MSEPWYTWDEEQEHTRQREDQEELERCRKSVVKLLVKHYQCLDAMRQLTKAMEDAADRLEAERKR